MKKRTSVILMFGLLFGISISGLSVFAQDGELSIDNSVINQQGQEAGNGEGSTLYQVAPDLFLEGKSRQAKELSGGASELLGKAKDQGFTKTDVQDAFQTDQILVGLFVEDIQSEDRIYETNASTRQGVPKWIFWIMALVVITLAGTGGVVLGQKYAKIFRKREKKR